jgi:hypothetical protein
MSDNSMVERWNIIDTAEMAVGLESVLSRYLREKPMPFDCLESLERGIEFLEEACNGGAIVCGSVQTSGFTGTLSPLRWSTRIVTRTSNETDEEMAIYKKVIDMLNLYKTMLKGIKEGKQKPDSSIVENAQYFFSTLADTLMREADPLTSSYSRPLS